FSALAGEPHGRRVFRHAPTRHAHRLRDLRPGFPRRRHRFNLVLLLRADRYARFHLASPLRYRKNRIVPGNTYFSKIQIVVATAKPAAIAMPSNTMRRWRKDTCLYVMRHLHPPFPRTLGAYPTLPQDAIPARSSEAAEGHMV